MVSRRVEAVISRKPLRAQGCSTVSCETRDPAAGSLPPRFPSVEARTPPRQTSLYITLLSSGYSIQLRLRDCSPPLNSSQGRPYSECADSFEGAPARVHRLPSPSCCWRRQRPSALVPDSRPLGPSGVRFQRPQTTDTSPASRASIYLLGTFALSAAHASISKKASTRVESWPRSPIE